MRHIRDVVIVLLVLFCAYLWDRLEDTRAQVAANFVLKDEDDCGFNKARRLEILKGFGW